MVCVSRRYLASWYVLRKEELLGLQPWLRMLQYYVFIARWRTIGVIKDALTNNRRTADDAPTMPNIRNDIQDARALEGGRSRYGLLQCSMLLCRIGGRSDLQYVEALQKRDAKKEMDTVAVEKEQQTDKKKRQPTKKVLATHGSVRRWYCAPLSPFVFL